MRISEIWGIIPDLDLWPVRHKIDSGEATAKRNYQKKIRIIYLGRDKQTNRTKRLHRCLFSRPKIKKKYILTVKHQTPNWQIFCSEPLLCYIWHHVKLLRYIFKSCCFLSERHWLLLVTSAVLLVSVSFCAFRTWQHIAKIEPFKVLNKRRHALVFLLLCITYAAISKASVRSNHMTSRSSKSRLKPQWSKHGARRA